MKLTLKTYLKYVQIQSRNNDLEHEALLKALHSDESINIMWETFTLQYKAAMKDNESIDSTLKVQDMSTRYLAALVICRTLHTRFISVTRIIYDLKSLYDFDIADTISNIITENKLFKDISSEEQKRKNKVEELLEEIQKPIFKKGNTDKEILKMAMQRHFEILYTALLLSENRHSYFTFISAALSSFEDRLYDHYGVYRMFGIPKTFFPLNYRSILCTLLFNTINEFHIYLAEISKEEE